MSVGWAQAGPRLMPQLGHGDGIAALAISPDGKRVLTGGRDASAIVWDPQSGLQRLRLDGHTAEVRAVAFAPDGRWAVTGGRDKAVYVWDVTTGARIRALGGHRRALRFVGFTADGQRLVTADRGGLVQVFDPQEWTVVRRESVNGTAMALHPEASELLIAGPAGVALWDLEAERGRRILAEADAPVTAAAYLGDGTGVVLGRADGSIERWTLEPSISRAFVTSHRGGAIREVAVDPAGTVAAVAADGSVAVGEAPPFAILDAQATHVAFAGPRLLTSGSGSAARVWDLANGTSLLRLEGHEAPISAIAGTSTTGITVSEDGTGQIWDLATGRALHGLTSRRDTLNWAAFSPRGDAMVMAHGDGTAVVWSPVSGAPQAVRFGPHVRESPDVDDADWVAGFEEVVSAQISPDGTRVATGGGRNASIWEVRSGTRLHELPAPDGTVVQTVAFSPDGSRIVVASGDLQVFDARSGREQWRKTLRGRKAVTYADWSRDGRFLVAAGKGGVATVYRANGKRVRTLTFGERGLMAAQFSPDGRRLALASGAGGVGIFDPSTGERTATLAVVRRRPTTFVSFSPDGATLVAASEDGRAYAYDVATGARQFRLKGHGDGLWSVQHSPDGRHLLTASRDGTAMIWDAQTGRSLATLIDFTDGSWAVVDPEGRFDGSDDGRVEHLAWVGDHGGLTLAQLRQRYYEPGLLGRILGHHGGVARTVPSLSGLGPPTQVEVEGPTAEGRMTLQLVDRGQGPGRLFVTLNAVDVSARVRAQCPELGTERCRVDLSAFPQWAPGRENRIAAEVRHAVTTSRGIDRLVMATGEWTGEEPDLWILAVGTSDYQGDELDLDYAARDATAFADAFSLAGGKAFGESRVHTRLLTTEPGSRVTRRELVDAFVWLSQASVDDTVVIFIAGHGVAHPDASGRDEYYYVLPHAKRFRDVADPHLRPSLTWSGREMADALTDVPALRRVVILDTCGSGAAGSIAKLPRAQVVRAHARARERTGAWLLAGSASDRVSYESPLYGQGLLTHALLRGLQGPALEPTGRLSVGGLFRHAENDVPALAQSLDVVQWPVVRRGGSDFVLGLLGAAERTAVPVARRKAVLARPSLVARAGHADRAGLTSALTRALTEASAEVSAPFVLWDTAPRSDTWQITGLIQRSRAACALRAEGFLSRTDSSEQIRWRACGQDADDVADKIVAEVSAALMTGR